MVVIADAVLSATLCVRFAAVLLLDVPPELHDGPTTTVAHIRCLGADGG
jgi:hypothetical protein